MTRLYSLLLSGLLLCLPSLLAAQNLTVSIGDADAELNRQFCVNITGENFVGIVGIQFSINYDPAVLRFVSAEGSINGSAFSLVQNASEPGVIRANYSPFTDVGYTDAGPFQMGQLCFRVRQVVETRISITSMPVPVEFTDDNEREIPASQITFNEGVINGGTGGQPTCSDGIQNGNETEVDCGGDCDPCPTCTDGIKNGREQGIDCGGDGCGPCDTGGGSDCGAGGSGFTLCLEEVCDVAVNAQVCLEMTVADFTLVSALQVDLLYPAANLDFVSVTGNAALGDPLQVNGSTDGEIAIVYLQNAQTGVTLEDGAVFGTVCFTNRTTSASPIQLSDLKVNDNSGQVANPTSNNGSINGCNTTPTCNDGVRNGNETGVDCGGSCAPCDTGGGGSGACGEGSNNLFFCLTDACDIPAGGQACIDLDVSNFDDVDGFQATVEYTNGNLLYQSITTNSALQDPIQVNVTTAGSFNMVYLQQAQTGITVADGTTIATLCFTNQNAGATGVNITDLRVSSDGSPVPSPMTTSGSVNDCTGTGTGCGNGTTDVTFCVGDACGSVGSEACVPVFIGNFQDLAGFQFTLNYPGGRLDYTRIVPAAELSAGLVAGNPSAGRIGITWTDPTATARDFPADRPAVEICFTVTADRESPFTFRNGSVAAFDDQGNRVDSQNGDPGGVNLNCSGNEEVCGENSSDLNICGGEACSVAVGAQACVDFTVANFDDVTGVQATLVYPAANLDYVSLTGNAALGDPIQANGSQDGTITLIYLQNSQSGVSLDDGAVFATVCFTNRSAAASEISFDRLLVSSNNGQVATVGNSATVNDCTTGTPTCTDGVQNGNETGVDCGGSCSPCEVSFDEITFAVTNNTGAVGQEVCVDVQGYKLINIAALQFGVGYDPTKLRLNSTAATGALPGLQISNPDPGALRVVWFDPSVQSNTVPDATSLLTMCFEVLEEACETPIRIVETDQLKIRVSDPENNALSPVETADGAINAGIPCGGGPANLVLNLGTGSGAVGQEVCLPLNVMNFTNLNRLSFSLTYDASAASFTRARNFGRNSINVSHVDGSTDGVVTFDWTVANGQTIAAGDKLLDLCFEVDRLVTTPVNFANSPVSIQARNAGAVNVGVIQNSGAINPNVPSFDGLTFQIGSTSADVNENICLPVIGYDVSDLVAFQYSISYDPDILEYTGPGTEFPLPGFSASTVRNSAPGVIRVVWDDPSTLGVDLPSGTVIYNLCFRVLKTDLAVVAFTDTPTDIEFETATNGTVMPTLINGQVNGGEALAIVRADLDPPSCSDGEDGSIRLTTTGGNALTYRWRPNVADGATADGLAAGDYRVTVTNPETGESVNESYTLEAPPAFSVKVDNLTNVSCNGQSDGAITIRTQGGTGPFTIDWQDDLPDATLTQTGLDAGRYSVTVTDANGCARVRSGIRVREGVGLVIGGSVTNIDGNDRGRINVVIEGGTEPFTYAWTGPGNYTSSREDINNIRVPGDYTVMVTDDIGCTASQTFTVLTQVAISRFDVTGGCAGQDNGAIDITVIGGDGNYTFRWARNGNRIATTEDVSGLAPGDYGVTVTSGTETTTAVISVDAPSAIEISGTVTPAIGGRDVGAIDLEVSGGNPDYTYRWSTGTTREDLTTIRPGEYCVTVTDESDCSANTCFTVADAALALASVTVEAANCGDSADGEVRVVVENGAGPFTARLGSDGTPVVSNSRTIRVPAAPGTYRLIVTDNQGETVTQEVTVTSPSGVTASVTTVSDTEDMECSGMISLALSGGSPNYAVAWSNGATGATINRLCAGAYQATVTDASGCSFTTDSIRIGRIEEELLDIGATACEDGNEGFVSVAITGGVEPYSYSWTETDSSEVLATSRDLTGVGPGSYTLTVADATGATLVRDYTVGVTSDFSVSVDITSDFGGFAVSCSDGDDGRFVVTVSGQSTYTYEVFREDQMIGIDSVVENALAGTYTVTVLDAGGCQLVRTFDLTAPDELVIDARIVDVSCAGNTDGRIEASATGGTTPYTYAWSIGSTSSNLQALGSGTYELTVTDAMGCQTVEALTVNEPEQLIVTLEATAATDECNGSIQVLPLGGSGSYSFMWPQLPNQGSNPLAQGLCPGEYTVIVNDLNGCQTVTMIVSVNDRRFPCLSAREVITPNGDGLNEAFVIFCSDGQEATDNNLEVYNRWGQLVFEMEDYACSTDGSLNCFEGMTNDGRILPAGPYYYVFNFQNPLGERMQQRGSLTIVRD